MRSLDREHLFTTKPIAPFKEIDLHELKNDQKLRDQLNKNNPFNVMHNQGVKKQLYLLFQVFNKIKEGDKLMAERDQKKEEKQVNEEDSGGDESLHEEKPIEYVKQETKTKGNHPNSRNQGLEQRRVGGTSAQVTFEDDQLMLKQNVVSHQTVQHHFPRKEKFMEASLMLKQLMNENERSRMHLQSMRKQSTQMMSQFKIRNNQEQQGEKPLKTKRNVQHIIDQHRQDKFKASIQKQVSLPRQPTPELVSRSHSPVRGYPKFMKQDTLNNSPRHNENSVSKKRRKSLRIKFNSNIPDKTQSRNKILAHKTFINIKSNKLVEQPDVYMQNINKSRFLRDQRIDPSIMQSYRENNYNSFSRKISQQYTDNEIIDYLTQQQQNEPRRKSTYSNLNLRGSYTVLNNSQIETPSQSLRKIVFNNLNKTDLDQNHRVAISPAVQEYIDSQIYKNKFMSSYGSSGLKKEYSITQKNPSPLIQTESSIRNIYIHGISNFKESLKLRKSKMNSTNRLTLKNLHNNNNSQQQYYNYPLVNIQTKPSQLSTTFYLQ